MPVLDGRASKYIRLQQRLPANLRLQLRSGKGNFLYKCSIFDNFPSEFQNTALQTLLSGAFKYVILFNDAAFVNECTDACVKQREILWQHVHRNKDGKMQIAATPSLAQNSLEILGQALSQMHKR